MSDVTRFFNAVPAAARKAYEVDGPRRMQALMAQARAHAPARTPKPDQVAPGAPEERTALDREHSIRTAYDSAASLNLDHTVVGRLLDAGVAPDQLGGELVQLYASGKARENARMSLHSDAGARITHSYDDPANVREAMSDAIAFPAIKALNPAHTLPDNGARRFMSYSAADFARESVARASGRPATSLHLSHVVGEALGNATSDFPNILSTSAHKVLLAAYENAAPTYRAVFAVQNVSNFQPHNLVQAGDFPQILELNEQGEITRGSMSDSAEVARLKSHGRTFGITRQALINDQLGAFTSMAAKAGMAVAALENSVCWSVFLSNPTLATTGAAVFSATHGNLTASGTAISATSLGIGRAILRGMKTLDGQLLNVAPSTLVVPAAKETIAEQVISPLVIPEASGNVTPQGLRSPALALVVEPLLDANSLTAWYLLGAPQRGACFTCGRLSGAEAPRLRTNSPFNVDGIEFQVLADFYAAAVDYRFGYKNAGA